MCFFNIIVYELGYVDNTLRGSQRETMLCLGQISEVETKLIPSWHIIARVQNCNWDRGYCLVLQSYSQEIEKQSNITGGIPNQGHQIESCLVHPTAPCAGAHNQSLKDRLDNVLLDQITNRTNMLRWPINSDSLSLSWKPRTHQVIILWIKLQLWPVASEVIEPNWHWRYIGSWGPSSCGGLWKWNHPDSWQPFPSSFRSCI